MLVRFRRDVLQLRPRVVVILGGINDLANTPLPTIEHNLAAMAQSANEHRICVVLATLPPAANSESQSESNSTSTTGPARDQLNSLDTWLVSLATQNRYILLDYHSSLADARGAYQPGLTYDGVHPTAEGYARMEPLLHQAVAAALNSNAP